MNFKSLLPNSIMITIAMIALQSPMAMALSPSEVAKLAKQVTVQIKSRNNGSGSGVLIKQEGETYTVLTAAHVVPTADQFTVNTSDGRSYPIKVSAIQLLNGLDLALIQFTSPRKYVIVKIGDSTALKVGNPAYISGFPKASLKSTETTYRFSIGEVVANATHPLQDGYALAYHTETFVGMSGGPVLGKEGELIGIHGRSQTAFNDNLGVNPETGLKFGLNLAIPIQFFLQKHSIQSSQPITADDFLIKGIEQDVRGNVQEAATDYEQSLKLNPRFAIAYFARAAHYDALGNNKSAIADYEKAIQLNPAFPMAYNNSGKIQIESGQLRDAIANFDKAVQLNPAFAMAYNNRGVAWSRLGDKRKAIADYDKAIQLNPDYPTAYSNRGNARLALGEMQSAIADYDKAIQLYPDFALAYSNRGQARLALGDREGARADVETAIQLNPNLALAYSNRGQVRTVLGDKKGAIEDFDKAIRLSPNNALFHYNRGVTRSELGDYQGGIADFNNAVQLNSSFAQAFYNRGVARSRTGDRTGAIADLQRAAKLFKAQGDEPKHKLLVDLLQQIDSQSLPYKQIKLD
jgi:tetratricopeptide (TPR) repeat protein